MEEWKEYKLGDITMMKNGKKRPQTNGRYPVFGGNGIMDYSNDFNSDRVIIVGRVGAYCGCVYKSEEKCWVSDNAIAVFPKEDVDFLFLYYLMNTLDFHYHHIGGAQPLMTQDIIGNFNIKLPSLKIQQHIASILKSLDDKIEANRKTNENLEQQAQALFKSWFVDFEPFKNGEFVESELGRIPKGWRVGTFGEIMTIASGKRPPKKESSFSHECNIPLVGASDIMGYTNSVLFNEDILVTGRVGTHGIVQRFNYPCWPSDNTLVLKSDYYEYCYQILCTIDYASLNRGSTQPLITQTDIKNQIILIPPYSVLSNFEKYASTLMKAKENNQRSSRRLAELRDTLLPKLMSGELIVNEIDDIL